MVAKNPARASKRVVDVEQSMAVIEKGQQLAGHLPSAEDLSRARRVLTGELTPEAARAEMHVALNELTESESAALRAAGSLVEPGEALPIEERPSVSTALRRETLLTEALTTDDVAQLLGVSTGRVRQRNGEGTLFSMSGASRGLRFPRFQFTDHGELPGWGTVCKSLPEHANPMAVEYFLSHTHPDLAGGEITPAQWLAAGNPRSPWLFSPSRRLRSDEQPAGPPGWG